MTPERFLFGPPGRPPLCELLKAAIQLHNEGADGHRAAQRSSLLKLALTSVDLHKVAMLKGVKPWRDGEGPLGVAVGRGR
jgi:hypothetical protein